MARPIVIYGGGLADLTQGQLAANGQADAAEASFRDYLARLDEIKQRKQAAQGQERVGMDANYSNRYASDNSAGASMFGSAANYGANRYATDASLTNAALANQFNRYALAQQTIDAEKNRQNQIALITAQGDQNFRLQNNALTVNPFGRDPKLAEAMYQNGAVIDQGNQDNTAITGQANSVLPNTVTSIPSWFTGDTAYNASLGKTNNYTTDDITRRSEILSQAQKMNGALDPAGIPRFSLPPGATNLVPMLRTNSNSMMRRVIMPQPDGTNALPVLRTGGFSTNSAGQIVVTTKAERDALPPGTTYVAPDGVVRTKSQ